MKIMKKILLVFGTRPEAIKMAPVVLELKRVKTVQSKVCVTGQHKELLRGVLDLFNIKADYNLDVMTEGQDLFELTTRILISMRSILESYEPDVVVVHGDTTTSFAASLAAFYKKIPVAHVEAGLRTKNLYNPWPEEANRNLTSRLAAYHFSPTQENKENLLAEGISEETILVTGNTVIDSLHYILSELSKKSGRTDKTLEAIEAAGYKLNSRKIVLITGHRRENFGDGFTKIFSAIKRLAKISPEVDFVYPVHLNPEVKNTAHNNLRDIYNIYLIPPIEYEHFVYLMNRAYFIITDSGGIQEEAPSLGKPVLVTRETTERTEGLVAGTIILVGSNENLILEYSRLLLEEPEFYEKMSERHNPYGDGYAAKRICSYLLASLSKKTTLDSVLGT